MKTVNDLINQLSALSPENREKPVVVNAENGLQFTAVVKLGLEDPYDYLSGVKNIVITYD